MSRTRVAAAAVLVALVAVLVVVLSGGSPPRPIVLPGAAFADQRADPFAYTSGRATDLAQRAARGEAPVIFSHSPGGVVATAARVARLRGLIEAAARGSGIDPDTLEGIVFLESAGRPDVRAPGSLSGAAGLTQILAETARDLLGMHVDLAASARVASALARAQAHGAQRAVARLVAERARVDERFDPAKALAGTVRYLQIARKTLGRDDLAVVSYHMGIGNLQRVIAAFGGGHPSYAQLYFDSGLDLHASAWNLLASFGDDSSLYYWKVLGAERLMTLYRTDPAALEREQTLQTASDSAEQVLHPPDATPVFVDPSALGRAYASRALVPLPAHPAPLFLRYDPALGALASRLGQQRALYEGLRPGALALLEYLAARVRAISHVAAPLSVAAAVRDEHYHALLPASDPESVPGYDLHTTGWAFDITRRYASRAQALAFQFMLDRLQALDLIAWQREPSVIHIVVAPDAAALVLRLRDGAIG